MRSLALLVALSGCGRCSSPDTEAPPAAEPPLEWGGFVEEALPGWSGPVVYGDAARATIADVNGPGVALLDADSDGDLDLYIAQGSTVARAAADRPGEPDRFFINDGRGRFTEATQAWGLDQRCWSQGVAAGDIDGDGDTDLFVGCLGPDVLLINDGGRWTRRELPTRGSAGWSASAAFGDADGDGDLDLYVARYVVFDPGEPPAPSPGMPCSWKGVRVSCGPKGLTPLADTLWINDGSGDLAPTTPPGRAAYGLGVLWTGDGIVVANDSSPNFLVRPQASGRLAEIGLLAGLSRSGDGQEQAGMGVAGGRLVGDDHLDLVMTHFSDDHHTVYGGLGGGMFRDRSFGTGLGQGTLPELGWGIGAYDFDLDGREDLLITHGHVYPQADRLDPDSGWLQRDHLWLQEAPGQLSELGARHGLTDRHAGRAAAFGDVDGDGDMDGVVIRLDAPPALYRNQGHKGRRWLRFRLTPAIPGAEVRLGDGQARTLLGGGSFQAASDPALYFGLGTWVGPIQWKASWPDGRTATGIADPDREVVVSAPSPS